MCVRRVAHLIDIFGQSARRVRIVRDVQNCGRLPGQNLKTPTHDGIGNPHAHRLLRHRQLLAQRIQRSQCRRRIGQLIITAHRRHGQAVARAVFADKAPLFALVVLNHLIAEIAVNQFQIRADGIRMIDQGLRRIRVGAHRRSMRAKNPCFFKTDGLARIPQKAHVVNIHRRYHCCCRVKHIGRVQAPAQTDLQNHRFRLLRIEPAHKHQQGELKIGQ